MDAQCGSYHYDRLGAQDRHQEVDRLGRQASLLLSLERRLWPSLGVTAGHQLLDIGCGSGVITQELAKQVYPAQATGVDISSELLAAGVDGDASDTACASGDECQSNPRQTAIKVAFQQGSVYGLPFPPESFDIVYARLLFQHLSEPMKALENIWSVLKPGGLLCVLDIDKDWSSLYPEPESSVALRQAIIQWQRDQGGDPWVGRKLGYYLNSAGYSQVKTAVHLVDSDQAGLANFFGSLSLGKQCPDRQPTLTPLQAQAQVDMQALLDSPYAWAGFGLFVVTGRKL